VASASLPISFAKSQCHVPAQPFAIDPRFSGVNNGGMDRDKIIFLRNFFYVAFVIGLIFALFYFAVTTLLWNTGVSLATHFFKIDEKEFGRLVLLFFIQLRVVVIFFFLVPALALHWMARRSN
jgi:hypothetical protein